MKKIYINYWVICLIFVGLFSCSNDDTQTLFTETPAERIDQRNSELLNLLLSQDQGYKGVYFTKNDEFGGFTFFMKFNTDGTVQMTSDFDSETDIQSSSYEVRFGTTTELVFTTRNHIQKVSETSPFDTDGFRGTSVFQYFSNENGVITLRDVRNRDTGTLIFEPTGFTDFNTESVASVDITYANRQAFTDVDCAIASVYDNLVMEINSGGETINYILNYDSNNIFFDAETTNAQGISSGQGFGVAFTLINGESAISISPALEVGDNSFKDFILDSSASEAQYIATVNGATAKIFQTSLSAPTGEDILDLPGLTYFYDTADGTNPLLSPCFQELVIDQINTNLNDRFGSGVLRFAFFAVFLDLDGNCTNLAVWLQDAGGNNFRANYCHLANIQSNTLFLDYQGPFAGPNDAFFEADVLPLIEFFGGPQGLIYTNEGTFSGSINSYTNAAGAFTSLDNESLRAYGLFF